MAIRGVDVTVDACVDDDTVVGISIFTGVAGLSEEIHPANKVNGMMAAKSILSIEASLISDKIEKHENRIRRFRLSKFTPVLKRALMKIYQNSYLIGSECIRYNFDVRADPKNILEVPSGSLEARFL